MKNFEIVNKTIIQRPFKISATSSAIANNHFKLKLCENFCPRNMYVWTKTYIYHVSKNHLLYFADLISTLAFDYMITHALTSHVN